METQNQKRLFSYLPGWNIDLCSLQRIRLTSPSANEAQLLICGGRNRLEQTAAKLGAVIEVLAPGCDRPLAKFGEPIKAVLNQPDEQAKTPEVSSYNPSRINSSASFETVLDFIKGKKAEGLIVTATSMVNDKCLIVNDLQALDRGGGWTAQDWIGIDFKTLWRDSFHRGKHNYYGDLLANVEADQFLPDFYYHIRRPSGALAEYNSTYHYAENFLGSPARIAVSVPGQWRVIEDAPDGSELRS